MEQLASINGLWDDVVSNMTTNVCEGILKEVQSAPERNEEWMEVCPNVHLDFFFLNLQTSSLGVHHG